MADTHPLYTRPRIHCGKCDHPLVFPRKKETDETDIAAGRAVLAECIPCGVAVLVPVEMFKPSDQKPAQTTIARPWSKKPIQLNPEQQQKLLNDRRRLGIPDFEQ